jgi:hypothetical protein
VIDTGAGARGWRGRALDVLPWALVVVAVVTVLLVDATHLPRGKGWRDVYVYARAASDFLGHPSHLYDGAHRQLDYPAPRATFIYPPSGLIPFLPLVPLTRAGINVTAMLWSTVDMVALLAGLVLIGRQLGVRMRTLGWALLAFALCGPFLNELGSGQVQGVVILLLALSWRTWPRTSSGVLLGVAMALKPLLPVLFLVPLALRRWRVTVVAVAIFLALNLVFVPALGMSSTRFYVLDFLPYLQTHVMQDPANLSLPSVLDTWVGGVSPSPWDTRPLSPLHSMLLAGVLVWTVRGALLLMLARVLWQRSLPPLHMFILALTLVPILAATAWPHYFVFAMPAVLVLLASPLRTVRVATGATLALLAVATTVFDIMGPQLAPYPPDIRHVRHIVAGIGMLVHSQLLVALCVVAFVAVALGARRVGLRRGQLLARRGGEMKVISSTPP